MNRILRPKTTSASSPFPLRIGLNLLYLLPGVVGGTQTYAVNLIQHLAVLDTMNEYFLFVNHESADLPLVDAPNFRRIVCPVRATRRINRYLWEQSILPLQLARHRVDLVHSLGYVGPLYPPCRHVVSVPDLNYLAFRDLMEGARQRILSTLIPRVARRAAHVVTISEYSKRQITTHIGIADEKVTVTYLAARVPADTKVSSGEQIPGRYGISHPYLIAFSSLSPHKNIVRLIQAFAQVCEEAPHHLVLMGHLPPGVDIRGEIERAGITSRVVITGYVPDEDIAPLLSHADLFVFPSLYEGFGLPVLEAQQAGVAVACSTAASLPEVAGEAAAMFDPHSVPEMASAIRRCLQDPVLRTSLVQKGHRNRERFSWTRTARETLGIYERVQETG